MVFLVKALIVTVRENPALAQRPQVYRAMQQFAFPGPCRARALGAGDFGGGRWQAFRRRRPAAPS